MRERDTNDPLEGLRVEAWDDDMVYDDLLGHARTDAQGRFSITFDEARFRDGFDLQPDLYFLVYRGDRLVHTSQSSVLRNAGASTRVDLLVDLPDLPARVRDIYLCIERIDDYNPVKPVEHVPAGVRYERDCMHNMGHHGGVIPPAEVAARALSALVYREYLDPDHLVPKVDKLVHADINEPAYHHRVPGTVIYAHPGELLRIHVCNRDVMPHSFHLHGLHFGIDSDGAWPFGTQATDGRRSDEICPGQSWTYTFLATEETVGAWPFHDHAQHPGPAIERGLFGAIIVLPEGQPEPCWPVFRPIKDLQRIIAEKGIRRIRLDDHDRMHLRHQQEWIDERLQAELVRGWWRACPVLHVPLFFHVMTHPDPAPAFDTGDIHENGGTASLVFDDAGDHAYFCRYHPAMEGTVRVQAGGLPSATVFIQSAPGGAQFNPALVTVAPGGTVTWVNEVDQHHTATSRQGAAIPTHCFNGRGFIGNSPTIVARAGQKIRWYIFNLDLGHTWHNHHVHAARWRFGAETVDVRSLGPAESFIIETEAPHPLLLTDEIRAIQDPKRRPADARLYRLKGDYLFHCHVHHHMMQGMAGLVRARQSVWLTPKMAQRIADEQGLPLDDGSNDCPAVDPHRCAKMGGGRIEEVPGLPHDIFMHACLIPNSERVLFWGKMNSTGTSQVYDAATDAFVDPANHPPQLPGETNASANLWSAAHAWLPDGRLLAHGGLTGDAAGQPTKSYLFDPATDAWSATDATEQARFYATTLPLADGRALTLVGNGGPVPVSRALETYDPAAGTWSRHGDLPDTWNYLYYPWTYLLPDGRLFIAGPQKTTRRFDWTAADVAATAEAWDMNHGPRGGNMQGTSVLLPLRAPDHRPVVYIMGGSPGGATDTVERIDLSDPAPAWTVEPAMNHARVACTSQLLPDGRIVVAGGIFGSGGPVEVFDPRDPGAGWVLGPELAYERVYHSAMVLLPDGSILVGGDDDGADPCERYYPDYCDMPRPTITGAPASVSHGATFQVQTPQASDVSEVVLMRPGAVTHGFDMGQRAIGLHIHGDVPGAVEVTAPPDGNVCPPGDYMLFILDGSRVPSVARWIRVA